MAKALVLKGGDLVQSASDIYEEGPINIPHCLHDFAVDGIFVSQNSWYMDFCAASSQQSWFQVDLGMVKKIKY